MANEINWQAMKMVSAGGAIPQNIWNQLIDIVHSGYVTSFKGGTFTRVFGAGTALAVNGIGGGAATTTFPYKGTDASDQYGPKVSIAFGTHNNQPPQIYGEDLIPPAGTPAPLLTLDSGAKIVYVEFDVTFDQYQNITSYDGFSIQSSNDMAPPPNTINFNADNSGSGSFYQTLFGVSVKTPSGAGGSYSVAISQNIMASQVFYVCGGGFAY